MPKIFFFWFTLCFPCTIYALCGKVETLDDS